VLACYESGLFFCLVVFSSAFDFLVGGKSQIVETFLAHEFMVHATLQIVLGIIAALVVHLLVFLQTLNVKLHGFTTFGAVIQRKDAALRWSHHLATGSHAAGGHAD